MPSAMSAICPRRPSGSAPLISAIRAMIPPSPSLSARMISSRYLTETMIVTDQKISESTP